MSNNKFINTPEERFTNLPGYDFDPKYKRVGGSMRMHYIDNESEGPCIVMLHGEPSWSYLYRKMIKVFQASGWRTIAPDLIGFGKSEKLTDRNNYTYALHEEWLDEWFQQVNLEKTYLFVQDWGGLLGLRLAVKHKVKINGLIIANTFLPAGHASANAAFEQWRDFSQNVPEFPVGKIINMATQTDLSKEVIKAYDAPFPDESFKEGARQFPVLVPFDYDDPECVRNREVWKELMQCEIPTLTLFSDSDPIMAGLEKVFQEKIPGCKDQPHEIIKGAGHFLQEDKGEEIAEKIIEWDKRLG
ncbi:MAG: haloalkane dehalogenase [Saprospiraceae bacterium]|nr:haloalkane dehalogenase [Saprospiraceae bacterium]